MREDSVSVVGGCGVGVGGGVFTIGGTVEAQDVQVRSLSVDVVGGSAFLLPKTNCPLTGGVSEAFVPTLSGIFEGSFDGAMASVRSGILMCWSTGALAGSGLRNGCDSCGLGVVSLCVTGGTQ